MNNRSWQQYAGTNTYLIEVSLRSLLFPMKENHNHIFYIVLPCASDIRCNNQRPTSSSRSTPISEEVPWLNQSRFPHFPQALLQSKQRGTAPMRSKRLSPSLSDKIFFFVTIVFAFAPSGGLSQDDRRFSCSDAALRWRFEKKKKRKKKNTRRETYGQNARLRVPM